MTAIRTLLSRLVRIEDKPQIALPSIPREVWEPSSHRTVGLTVHVWAADIVEARGLSKSVRLLIRQAGAAPDGATLPALPRARRQKPKGGRKL